MNKQKIELLQKQLIYIKAMGRDVNKDDYFDLFPINWHSSKNYILKSEILDEALEKKCLINDTFLYVNTMQEGVVDLSTMIKVRQKRKKSE